MSKLWPEGIREFFEANHKGRSSKEMADLLNKTFGTSYTPAQVKGYRGRYHLNSELTGRFEKGHIPHNKGKKVGSYPGMAETQFKPGNRPHNYRPVGSERINADGYRERKIADPSTWRAIHILNWEQVHGPVPKGCCLIFKDHNHLNCELDNLLLVTRGELSVMNRKGLCKSNPEATETGHILAKYLKAVKVKKKARKKVRQ